MKSSVKFLQAHRTYLNRVLIILTVIAFLAAVCVGQNVMPSDYKADQVLKSNARVNPTSRAMEFSLPIGGYKGRGSNGLPISFSYSSKVWQMETFWGGPFQFMSGIKTAVRPLYAKRTAAGWSSNLGSPRVEFPPNVYEASHPGSMYIGQLYQPVICTSNCSTENYDLHYIKRLQVIMPDGASHEFRKDDTLYAAGTANAPGSQDMTGTFLSVDGTRMRLEITSSSSTLFLPDGSRYLFGSTSQPDSFIDRSGNKMTFNRSTRTWTDTIGRTVTDPIPFNGETQTQTVGTIEAAFPGVGSSTLDVDFVWAYLKHPSTNASVIDDPDNTSQTLHYASDYYCVNGGAVGHYYRAGEHLFNNPESTTTWVCSDATARFNPIVLSQINLPNGQSYQFKYNAFGEITKIIYPTGGYERFKYGYVVPVQPADASYDQANRGVVDRWVSEKGDGTDEVHWQYDDDTFTITAPDGTRTEQSVYVETVTAPQPYGFGDAKTGRPYEERSYSSSNQLLVRKLTSYETTGPTSGGYADATRDLRPNKEITIQFEPENTYALASMTETVYDTTGNSDPAYFSALNPKQTKAYNYVSVIASTATSANIATASGWFSSSDLASTTEIDYLYDSNYKARNINGLVTETRIKDAGGSVKAKSQVVYDESSYVTTSSGTMPTAASGSWVDLTSSSELGPTIGSKRGLPTTVKSYYDIANSYYVETHNFYDQYGNLRKARDGRGNDTETLYDDDYAFTYPTKVVTPIPDSAGTYGLNDELETTSTYDYDTGLPLTVTDPNGAVTEMEYADALFRPTKVTAPNDAETITEYGAGTSASTRWVKVKSQIDGTNWKEGLTWFDGLGRTIRTQSVDDDGDVSVLTCYDNMGRVSKASNPFRGYSNQTCSTTSGMEWTANTFDSAGRPWKVTTPDGAIVETTYGLAATSGYLLGTVVTVTDQAGKLRRSVTNALGQLKRVDEPNGSNVLGSLTSPNQDTSYSYDILNNLTTVTQGAQTRSFSYDSLSRLKEATNPESGTIKYTYDSNSNLKTKWDARGIKTIYDYDTLNRVWKRCYKSVGMSSLGNTTCATASSETAESNTPDVTYYYDNATNAKGKLTKVTSSVSTTEYTSFDIVGRVTGSKQTTDGVTYGNGSSDSLMTYTYNLSGAMIEQQYPSGRKIQNTFDASGDLEMVSSRKNANAGYWAYANNFSYNAARAVTSMQLGNGTWESTTFNSRLQPTQIALGVTQGATGVLKLDYKYGEWVSGSIDESKNNGNIVRQIITVPTVGTNNGFTATQKYYYDSLNRIDDATEEISSSQTWRQDFTYDRYGNRNLVEANTSMEGFLKECSGNTALCPALRKKLNPAINTSNNRLSTSDDYAFDSSGNTTSDPDSRLFVYDGENKQVEVKNSSNQTIGKYWYDGDGRRVKKYVPPVGANPGETTIFVYDTAGKLVAEYSTIVASTQDAKVAYLTNDHLGSPRINTDRDGSITARHDYHPFGEEIATSQRTAGLHYADDTVRKQFTGYERDKETGLDFAEARMLNNAVGRFGTPDPYNVILEKEKGKDADEKSQIFISFSANPQRWNSYVYVINNPLALTDPDGREPRTINLFLGLANAEGLKDWEKFAAEARKKGYKVTIYTKGNGFTADKFLESLKAKDTVTIFSGHSLSTQDGKRLGINFGDDSGRNAIGNSEVQPKLGRTADGVDIRNDIVAVFSCGFGKGFDNITSSTRAAFVSIVQGGQQTTMADSVDRAARNFFESITTNPVDSLGRDFNSARDHHLGQANARAQTAMTEFGYAPQNDGDVVLHRYLSRTKRR